MAADFDIAVCERVINYLLYKASGNRMQFAVNLSGQSVQNEQFFKKLLTKLNAQKELAQRIVFEITESTTITELGVVNHYIGELQKSGFRVCLDDFGAGGTSFQYLQQLQVDYIKIDGQYTRKILDSRRDQILVKNLCQTCKDLGIVPIAEMIEKVEQRQMMVKLGVQMGQGYYFGYPGTKPEFDAEKLPAKPR